MTREEAINEIKSWDFLEGKEIEAIHTLIPELAESEDEKAIKLIRSLLENARNVQSNTSLYKQYDDAIAWLEKQKEQKPVKCELEDAFKYYTDAGITVSCGDIVAKPEEQKPLTAEEYSKRFDELYKNHPWYMQKSADKCPEYCVMSTCMGCPIYEKQKEKKPILEVFGFKVGDAVRLKDGDGRKHIIKSFEEIEGVHGPNFYHVEFEDNSARDGIYPGEEYPNGYYTQMEKIDEQKEQEQNPLVRILEDKKAITEDIRNGIPTKTIEKERNVKFATPVDVSHIEWSKDERMIDWIIAHLATEDDDKLGNAIAWLENQKEEEGYEVIPVESTLEYKLGFKAGKESEKQKEQKLNFDIHWENGSMVCEQKEQKPNIELIQRSWYMEGYHDREFGKEPKWIIKTGEGGPKHELNPKYGQPLADEQKPAEWSDEDEKMLNDILGILHSTEDAALANFSEQKKWLKSLRPIKQEWSEEDEKIRNLAIEWAETMSDQLNFVDMDPTDFRKITTWLKSLPISLKKNEDVAKLCSNEWNEEDEKILHEIEQCVYNNVVNIGTVNKVKYIDFLKSLRPQPKQEWKHYIWAYNLRFNEDALVIYEDNGECEFVRQGNKPRRNVSGTYILIKDIYPQPHWKPTEEQIYSLGTVVKGCNECNVGSVGYNLKDLYEQLKRLM